MAALTPAAGEGLVAALQRAQAELQSIQNRLEEEHAAASRKGDVNTLSLLTRLNRLRRELPAVQQECQQVLAAKQELVDAVKLGLGANTEQLHKLRRHAGIPADAASDDTYASFKAAVREHEARLQASYAAAHGQQFDRAELNEAFVQSTLA
ncbi:spindle and kinetochore-associated 2 isoform X1 [Micractinium conductrix]|uniref:Protein FAM33A n=1 Tax=Micractinium conductrix TaxID=554055 RepID=A0A2P6VMP3_9CHLO|nr:spindle and kinetochore-associated 2 isoform X1 [Micractinium conductrix]|eukprot:PSC75315.1 spindle and kinetochore-associated 2 isoform X1 [Micractinium conductrix]